MPGLNQTGPMGQGPITGRRMGSCKAIGTNPKSQNLVHSENPDQNLHVNFAGRGFGFGWNRCGRSRDMGLQNRFRGGN